MFISLTLHSSYRKAVPQPESHQVVEQRSEEIHGLRLSTDDGRTTTSLRTPQRLRESRKAREKCLEDRDH